MKKFELPQLNYNYNALEPYIDEMTMEIHHSRHHQAYTDNFNKALEGYEAKIEGMSAEDIIKNAKNIFDDSVYQAVINNGGGYINHALFFDILKKDVKISDSFLALINEAFGSLDGFKEEFTKAATTQFGSGWAWLVVNNGKLEIVKTANQDSVLASNKIPIMGIDVWEHAYYLKYQNKRPAYIENFFNVIDWENVENRYLAAIKNM